MPDGLASTERAISNTEVRSESSAQSAPAHFSEVTAPSLESQPLQKSIRPLGEQIIIRVIPPLSVGSIIIPDSAKRITYGGSAKATPNSDELQYVNRALYEQLAQAVRMLADEIPPTMEDMEYLKDLSKRAQKAILPKAAKGIAQSDGNVINFVEAEVVAVGPGKRAHDRHLVSDLVKCLRNFLRTDLDVRYVDAARDAEHVLQRYFHPDDRRTLQVKPGDRILYHPAVQRFDRKIDPALIGLPDTEECYIISEQTSVLAVLERE